MSPILLAVLAGVIVVFVIWAPLRAAFVGLIAVSWLIPAALTLPFSASAYPSLHRLALAGFAVGLIRRGRRGELRRDIVRPTALSAALFGYAAIAFFIGVVLGDPDVKIGASLGSWLSIADSVAFYGLVLIAIRAIGDIGWVAKAVAGVFIAAAGIAVGEHFSHWSYGRWFFEAVPPQNPPPGSFPLEVRGGDVRVRAAADFALAYAWVSVSALPLVLAVTAKAKRAAAVLFAAMLAVTIIWTYSRSAYAGIAAGAVVLILGSRFDRRVTAVMVLGATVGLLTIGYQNVVRPTFRDENAAASSELREERFPAVLSQPVKHPFLGIGLAGLAQHGIESTDASFLLVYAELGVVGLLAFSLLIVLSLRWVVPALRAPPGPDRLIAAAVLAGMFSALIGAFAYDGFHVGSARPYWLLAAMGTSIAERVKALSPLRIGVVVRRALLPAAGVVAGLVLLATSVPRAAVTFDFLTVHPSTDVIQSTDTFFLGDIYRNTVCEVIRSVGDASRDGSASCFDLENGAAGMGQARFEARNPKAVEALVLRARTAAVTAVHGFRSFRVSQDYRARPTWVRTAPVWCAGIGLAIALLLPVIRVRRREPAPAFAV